MFSSAFAALQFAEFQVVTELCCCYYSWQASVVDPATLARHALAFAWGCIARAAGAVACEGV